MTNKTYRIETVHDIFEVVTSENIDRFMLDFYRMLSIFSAAKENMTEEEIRGIEHTHFDWEDDGKNNITFDISARDD